MIAAFANTHKTCSSFTIPLVLGLIGVIFSASPLLADAISFTVTSTSVSTTSGGDAVFMGSVTNDSGGDLSASDFFFNFMGYDSTGVTPNQDLGIDPDSSSLDIPNGTTSPVVALFDVALGSASPGSTFPVQVDLEDINNDLSSIVTVDVSVSGSAGTGGSGGTTPIPEPSSLLLLGVGLATLVSQRNRLVSRR